jgi:hypothetical protein
MFLCEDCTTQNLKWQHGFMVDYGKCENCGRSLGTKDIPRYAADDIIDPRWQDNIADSNTIKEIRDRRGY